MPANKRHAEDAVADADSIAAPANKQAKKGKGVTLQYSITDSL
jgi:hypothetical protein